MRTQAAVLYQAGTSPAGSGMVDVQVQTAGGTSAKSSADQFFYGSPPAVTGLSPSSGPVAGGTAVTITGTSFTSATEVRFGDTPATSFTAGQTRPAVVRTYLATSPDRIHDLERKFEQLWDAADPERKIDE